LQATAALSALQGLENIGVVEFRKSMRFDMEVLIMLTPKLAGVAVAIPLALIHPTYWSLVAGIAVGRVVRIVLTSTMNSYPPRLSLSCWRELLGFSLWMWVFSVAQFMRDQADTFVVGRMFNASIVGVFKLGMEMAILPTGEVIQPICRALFPGLAAVDRDGN